MEKMPSFPFRKGHRSKRAMSENRASLIINPDRKPERLPCLVLDSSNEGFRLRGIFRLKPGQLVEVVLDDDQFNFRRCRVIWVGKAGSKQEGEAGLRETVLRRGTQRRRAFVVITTEPGKSREIARQVASLPGVRVADAGWGSRDVLAVIEFRESRALNKLVIDKIQRLEGVRETSTHIAIE